MSIYPRWYHINISEIYRNDSKISEIQRLYYRPLLSGASLETPLTTLVDIEGPTEDRWEKMSLALKFWKLDSVLVSLCFLYFPPPTHICTSPVSIYTERSSCRKSHGEVKMPTQGPAALGLLLPHASLNHCHQEYIMLPHTTPPHLMDHPLYSPNLAPCDFWLFPKIKSKLARGGGGGVQRYMIRLRLVIQNSGGIPALEYRAWVLLKVAHENATLHRHRWKLFQRNVTVIPCGWSFWSRPTLVQSGVCQKFIRVKNTHVLSRCKK